jgi:hypothetical protein
MQLALASEGQGTWDLTDFSERRILSAFGRENLPVSPRFRDWRARLPMRRKIFRQCWSTALQKNYSLLAIRYSLPFRPAGTSPSHFIPSFVPRPSSHSKSAFRFFVTNYELKSVAWFAFGCVINYGLNPAAWMTHFAVTTIN